MRLDLGSGQVGPREGFEGVDKYPYEGVAFFCDLESFPWMMADIHAPLDPRGLPPDHPMPDSCVEGIHCAHLVEHIRDLNGFMAEMWRVCKDGAEVEISHPYQFNVRAWQDPTHVRALNEISFFYYDKEWRQERNEFGADTDFVVVECDAIPESNWAEMARENPEAFERAARNQINVISDLRWILRCRK